MKAIEEIYEGFVESQQDIDTAETNAIAGEILCGLERLLPMEQSSKLFGLALELAESGQKQGFMAGFKLAVRMMKECE